eukprot:COSAG01_NODE_5318_length_4337_cov_11.889571_7_plen_138_part_01
MAAAAASPTPRLDPMGALPVSRAFPSWKRSIVTEIYLLVCHTCSHHGAEDGNARAGEAARTRSVVVAQINCTVTNVGAELDGDEVVMLMHRYAGLPPSGWASPIPRRSLRDFVRVSVTKGGGSAQLGFSVPQQALALT